MVPKLIALVFLLISLSLCFLTPSTLAHNDMNWWCNQTPYPEPCKHSMQNLKPKSMSEFRQMAIRIAKDRAILALNNTKELDSNYKNHTQKVALANCVTLYKSAIYELNRILNPSNYNKNYTEFDEQTWLSTTLTNLEVCHAGFVELGMSNNNVSKLVSNALAMNSNTSLIDIKYQQGFPTWISRYDRRLLQSCASMAANLVVAQDGSGNHRTISEGLVAASKQKRRAGKFVIYVKSGVYAENLVIDRNLDNIMLVGDGIGKTIITGNRSNRGGFNILNSATVAIEADGFIAKGVTIRNTAGPQNNQAVALRVSSDLSAFYRCSFEGYQDTLYAFSQRQFYRQCTITGTVDFIFGNAASVFQNCNIVVRKPVKSQKNTVTAQGRTDPNQNTGFAIQNSRIIAGSDLSPVINSYQTYLGRPWKKYSRTIVVDSFVDKLIDPAGWLPWNGNFALNTLFYAEFRNSGPGSSLKERVKWKGYKVISNVDQVTQFSAANFIAGQSWLPATGVPFTPGI